MERIKRHTRLLKSTTPHSLRGCRGGGMKSLGVLEIGVVIIEGVGKIKKRSKFGQKLHEFEKN